VAAAAEGAIGAGQIDAIITTMKAIPTTMSEHDHTGAEKTVVDLACDTGPRENGRTGTRLPDTVDPDGPEPKGPNPLKPPPPHIPLARPHRQSFGNGTATRPPQPLTR
jgi:hypothetical protein